MHTIIAQFTLTHAAGSVVKVYEDLYYIQLGSGLKVEVREDYFNKGTWTINWQACGAQSIEDAQTYAELLTYAARFAKGL